MKRASIDRRTFAPFLLEVITNRIGSNVNRRYQKKFGVGLSEWRILSALALEPGMTILGLSDLSSIDAGAVSRVVFSMSERGLVSQAIDLADRRRRRIKLTKAGVQLHDAMLEVAFFEEQRLLTILSDPERRAFISILQKLYLRVSERTHLAPVPPAKINRSRIAKAASAI